LLNVSIFYLLSEENSPKVSLTALLNNHVNGVATPFRKSLMIIGVGFSSRLQGKDLVLQIGFSHPVTHPIPEGIKVDVPNPQRIDISGVNKQLVGQFAANVRRTRPPEPYKEKGIRYDGERIRKKAGKSLGSK
jgi:large subunit ribosomal protein L6